MEDALFEAESDEAVNDKQGSFLSAEQTKLDPRRIRAEIHALAYSNARPRNVPGISFVLGLKPKDDILLTLPWVREELEAACRQADAIAATLPPPR